MDPACDSIRAWTKNFVRQLRGLVPHAVYMDVVDSVLDVWDVMLAGVLVRDVSAVDVETDVEVQARTIGYRPFFILLQADFSFHGMGHLNDEVLQETEWM